MHAIATQSVQLASLRTHVAKQDKLIAKQSQLLAELRSSLVGHQARGYADRLRQALVASRRTDGTVASSVGDDGTSVVELILPEGRLGVAIASSDSDSSWFVVFSHGLAKEPRYGLLATLDLDVELRALLVE